MKATPRNVAGFLRRAFSLKKTRNVGVVGRESYKFTITLNARRVLLEKTHESGRVGATRVFLEKKIRNPGGVGRITCQFTVTLNARCILPKKTQGIWGAGTARIFIEKHRGVGHPWHINLQSK